MDFPDSGISIAEENLDLKKNAVTQVRPRSKARIRVHSLDSSIPRNSRSSKLLHRRPDSETRLPMGYEVRFILPDFKTYIDRWNTYLTNPRECPVIKERLEIHRNKYHSNKNNTPQISVRTIAVGPSFMELASYKKSTVSKNPNYPKHSAYTSADHMSQRTKPIHPKKGQCIDPFSLDNRYSSINKSFLKSSLSWKRGCKAVDSLNTNNQEANTINNLEAKPVNSNSINTHALTTEITQVNQDNSLRSNDNSTKNDYANDIEKTQFYNHGTKANYAMNINGEPNSVNITGIKVNNPVDSDGKDRTNNISYNNERNICNDMNNCNELIVSDKKYNDDRSNFCNDMKKDNKVEGNINTSDMNQINLSNNKSGFNNYANQSCLKNGSDIPIYEKNIKTEFDSVFNDSNGFNGINRHMNSDDNEANGNRFFNYDNGIGITNFNNGMNEIIKNNINMPGFAKDYRMTFKTDLKNESKYYGNRRNFRYHMKNYENVNDMNRTNFNNDQNTLNNYANPNNLEKETNKPINENDYKINFNNAFNDNNGMNGSNRFMSYYNNEANGKLFFNNDNGIGINHSNNGINNNAANFYHINEMYSNDLNKTNKTYANSFNVGNIIDNPGLYDKTNHENNNSYMNNIYGTKIDFHDGLRNNESRVRNNNPCLFTNNDSGINKKHLTNLYTDLSNQSRIVTPLISGVFNNNQYPRNNGINSKNCCMKTAMMLPSEICHDEKNLNCPIKVCSNSYRYNLPTNKLNEHLNRFNNANEYGLDLDKSVSRKVTHKSDVGVRECPQCDNNSKISEPGACKIFTANTLGEASIFELSELNSTTTNGKTETIYPYPQSSFKTPNVYETYLHEEVNNWLKKVPFYLNKDSCVKEDRQNIINDMTDRLKFLVENVDDDNYIELVKKEINKCIDNLHIWYPGAYRDQTGWRERLCESLLNSIKEMNKLLIRDKKCGDTEKYLKQFRADKCTSADKEVEGVGCSHCIDKCDGNMCKKSESEPCVKPCKSCKLELEKEIQVWLNKSNILQPFDVISKKDLKKMLANKVSPYLFKKYVPMNKFQIKSEIVDTLQSLPICINSMINHKTNTMKHVNELTDRLLLFQTKHKRNTTCKFSGCLDDETDIFLDKVPNGKKRVYCDEVAKVKNKVFAVGNDLMDFLIEEVKFCLGNTALEYDRSVEKSTLDILLKNTEDIKEGNDNRAKVELFRLFQNTGKMTVAETLNLVKFVMRTVKDVFKLKFSNTYETNKIKNPLLVLTYYSGVSLYNENHKMPSINKSSRLSQYKESFLNIVSAMIKEWLVSIENDATNVPDESKTIIANELAKSILKQTQLKCLNPKVTPSDKLKIWRVFIYKWLNKHKLYDDLNAADVKVSVLVSRLSNVQVLRTHNRMNSFGINYVNDEYFAKNFLKIKDRKKTKLKHVLHNFLKKEFENTNNDIEKMKYLTNTLDNDCTDKSKIGTSFQILNLELQTKSDTALALKGSRKNIRSQRDPSDDVKDVLLKYIDHNDDIDDLVARNAAILILVRKLQKISKRFKTDLFERENINFSIPVLEQELRYISVISDWLKSMTILCNINEEGSKMRTSFVNSLAGKIYKVEASRSIVQDETKHYNVLVHVIIESLSVLPFPSEDLSNIPQKADELAITVLNLNNVTLRYNRHTRASTPEQKLCEFLEEYLRLYINDLYDDHLKLEAISKRVIDELKLMDGSQPSVNDEINNLFICDETTSQVERIEAELHYSKEISEWLKNLPVPENCLEIKARMVSDLAERTYVRDVNIANKDKHAYKDFDNYIDDWIDHLPLDGNVDVPIATQQLKRRTDPIKPKDKRCKSLPPSEPGNKWYHKILLRKNKTKHAEQDNIVDVIEDESNNLSLKGDKPTVKKIKLEVANSLYQTVSLLNSNPVIFNNANLYKNTLADEIESQLNKIPAKYISQGDKKRFKNNLLNGIMAAKSVRNDVNDGHFYEQRLEQTIETSIPNPIQDPVGKYPGFEIYKHRLAEMFIADNFDHSNPAVKLKYQKQIQTEIDKYFADAQKRNAILLTREQMQNELYSALFRVPIPNEDAICDEVAEVKTRSEVDQWLNELPLREHTGMVELLEWDQILTAMTRKVYKIEKNKPPNCESKMYDEILKWLLKLPLLPGANVNDLIWRLIDRLKATKEERKCVKYTEAPELRLKPLPSKISSEISENSWSMPLPVNLTITDYKSIDLLIDTVENWANQIPLPAKTQAEEDENNILRDNITTNIIMKISELNSKPEIFDNKDLYHNLVAREIHSVFIDLPQTDGLVQSKNARVNQLTEGIISLRPHVLEDRDRYQYKDELLFGLINTLNQPKPRNEKENVIIDNINEKIIESFLEYKHGYRDDTSRVYHKNKIEEAVTEYLQRIIIKANDNVDPLMMMNRVITALSKVHPLNPVTIVEDIQINRLKNEVKGFIKAFSSEETDFVKNAQNHLVKALFEEEKSGHTSETEQAMKIDIENAMKAIGITSECNEIDIFIKRLRENEAARKLVVPRIGNSTSNRDLTPVRKPISPTTSVFSVISFVNGSALNSFAFEDMSLEQDEAINKLRRSASNQTASFFPFNNLHPSSYPVQGPSFEATIPPYYSQINSQPLFIQHVNQGVQLTSPATYGEGQCCEPVTPTCCQPVEPPCCQNQELGLQVNQTDRSMQDTSTEWFPMQQGTYIGNLIGFQDISLSQPNNPVSYLTDSGQLVSSSQFAVEARPSSSPIYGVPKQTEWQFSQSNAQNVPGFPNQYFSDSNHLDPRYTPRNISSLPPAHYMDAQQTVFQNLQSMMQGDLPYSRFPGELQIGLSLQPRQQQMSAPNYTQWQEQGINLQNFQGLVESGYVDRIPEFSPLQAGTQIRQGSPISYAGFSGSGPAASMPIRQADWNTQLPSCCTVRSQTQSVQTPTIGAQIDGSQWLPLEESNAVQIQEHPMQMQSNILTQMQKSPTHMQGSPIQMQEYPSQIQESSIQMQRQDTPISYTGFTLRSESIPSTTCCVPQLPVCCRERSQRQNMQTPPNTDGSQWFTLEDRTAIQIQKPNSPISIRQNPLNSYPGFAGQSQITSLPTQYPSQFHTNQISPSTTGRPVTAQSYQPDRTQWLTIEDQIIPLQNLPGFNAKNQGTLFFSNDTDPHQSQLSYSEFIEDIPTSSSLIFSGQESPQLGVRTTENSKSEWVSLPFGTPMQYLSRMQDFSSQSNQMDSHGPNFSVPQISQNQSPNVTPLKANGTQWLNLEQGTTAHMESTPLQMQGTPIQMQDINLQMQGTPIQMQGHYLQVQGTPVQMQRTQTQMQGSPMQKQCAPMHMPGSPSVLNPYPGMNRGSQNASLRISPEQYSQIQNQGARRHFFCGNQGCNSNQSNEVISNRWGHLFTQYCNDQNASQNPQQSIQQPLQQIEAVKTPTCCRFRNSQRTP